MELINNNGTSSVALTLFSIIIGGLVTAIVGIYKARSEASEARRNAEEAKKNTINVSNGFSKRVDDKLDAIIEEQNDLAQAIRDHLQWHVNQKG